MFVAGLVALGVAIVPAVMMMLQHFAGLKLPGCGEGSPCAAAASSVWGQLPIPGTGFSWSVSFIGLAFFVSMLAAWVAGRGRLSGPMRLLARLGALVSLIYLVIIVAGGYFCPYCIASHLGNLAFWIIAERSPRAARDARALGALGFTCVFALATAALGVAEWRHRVAASRRAEQQRQHSTEKIVQATRAGSDDDAGGDDGAAASLYSAAKPFTGRWHLGPKEAPIRLVVFSDYQCRDCKRVENEIRQLMQQRADINLSVKHFPFCRPCNRFVTTDMHPNACWAARAAETAGLMGGTTAFWEMHHWLFDKGGGFTDAELNARLVTTGYKVNEFIAKMSSDETLRRVQADVDEVIALGIHFTPMIFVNGVEFKGWDKSGALARTIAEVAATNPPARGPDLDRPPPAAEKLIDDWRIQAVITLPVDPHVHALGGDRASAATTATVVMWGDYEDKATMEADGAIRAMLDDRPDLRYEFRHYPVNQSCNPHAARTAYPNSCRMSAAAEAAGSLGGEAAYWRMHAWLLANQKSFTDEPLRAAAGEFGIDFESLMAAMSSPDVAGAVREDCDAANILKPRFVPVIYVNGRLVPRWRLEGHDILGQIVDEATKN
jgi:protein-disulfide isomerase/uncharacterized membrane protein